MIASIYFTGKSDLKNIAHFVKQYQNTFFLYKNNIFFASNIVCDLLIFLINIAYVEIFYISAYFVKINKIFLIFYKYYILC